MDMQYSTNISVLLHRVWKVVCEKHFRHLLQIIADSLQLFGGAKKNLLKEEEAFFCSL